MPLNKAHEGYEYQDLLISSFILTELLQGNNSIVKIDKKEFDKDVIDDVTIINSSYTQKKQIKYSSGESQHVLGISDLTKSSKYNISVSQLFNTWYNTKDRNNLELKLCLAWKKPKDEILNFLIELDVPKNNYSTLIYNLDSLKIWKDKNKLNSKWAEILQVPNCNKDNFFKFCSCLFIEIEYPEFSNDIFNPSTLERIALYQCKKLGIGIYPNDKILVENFLLKLVHIVKQHRGRKNNIELDTKEIIYQLGIKCDFGKIEQKFPINTNENITLNYQITRFLEVLKNNSQILLVGEPGSGKSYFVHNLQKRLEKEGGVVIKHLCYTKLDDEFYSDRIKKNIFIGNLISELIENYPDLQSNKYYKYGSDINELNLLIESIDQPTYLIVDGLDHIERIFYYRNIESLQKSEIAIIDTLLEISTNHLLKIIVVSQNIEELKRFTNYNRYYIEQWKEVDVLSYLKKNKIPNSKDNQGTLLSKTLLNKSDGNALYLKFLLDEFKQNDSILVELPKHQYNLSSYYSYLLSKLDIGSDLPQILSGVNFSLNITELNEISPNGNYIEKSIQTLRPILKINLSDNGFVVYHESFRRFILEKLQQEGVSIEARVYQPIISWFGQKDFFRYGKSFKHYLKILLLNNKHKEIIKLFDEKYVIKSVIEGNAWHYIVSNFHIFKQSISLLNRLDKLILLNEVNKVIVSTQDSYYQLFPQYIECLGYQKGYELALESLLKNNKPTTDINNGLKICYFCDEKGIVAPWQEYLLLADKDTRLENQDLKYYYRGLICIEDKKQLVKIAKQIIRKKSYLEYKDFIDELALCQKKPFVEQLVKNNLAIEYLINYPFNTLNSAFEIEELIDKILTIKSVYNTEIDWLRSFFKIIDNSDTNFESIIIQLNSKSDKNWFYNWILFYVSVIARKNGRLNHTSIVDIFKGLTISTEPFKGEPRTCDLYYCENLIQMSIREGLTLIESNVDWNTILEIILKASEETATSFQRHQSGPLPALELIEILVEFHSPINADKIEQIIEYLLKDKSDYHLYYSLAEYYYTVSCLFYKNNKSEKAFHYYGIAVKYSVAYTHRKDYYFEDPLKACNYLSKIRNQTLHQKDFETLYSCALEIYNHTDGKGTKHYPIQWFEYYSKFNFNKAGLFLIDNLLHNTYNWWDSDSIVEFLQSSFKQTDTLLQFYLCYTFPVECNFEYLKYALSLLKKLKKNNHQHFEQFLSRISPHFINKEPNNLTNEIVEEYNNIVKDLYPNLISKKLKEKDEDSFESELESINSKTDININDNASIILFLKECRIDRNFIGIARRIFVQDLNLNDYTKSYIQILVQRTNRYDYKGINIDALFSYSREADCYYWMSKYIHYVDGWFTKCSKIDYFVKSFTINPKLSIQYLFELISSEYDDGYFRSGISSNLIKSLIEVGYEDKVVEKMWLELKSVLITRFPNFKKKNISSKFVNHNELNSNEILICVLICQYRIEATEKSQWVITCLNNLICNREKVVIKPIIWFFKNCSHFPNSLISSILKMLFHDKIKGGLFYKKFEKAIIEINTTEPHFSIDYYKFKLYNKTALYIKNLKSIDLPPLENGLTDFLESLNLRFRLFKRVGIDLNSVFTKFFSTKDFVNKNKFEKFWNRSHKCFVPNTVNAEYMNDLLNNQLYDSLLLWTMIEDDILLNQVLGIDVETIRAKSNSIRLRPSELLIPADYTNEKGIEKIEVVNGWVRLGHFEQQIVTDRVNEPKYNKSFGGVIFSSNTSTYNFPYSTYQLFPHQIWDGYFPNYNIENEVVFLLLQKDILENYELLWLNPVIIEKLGLAVKIDDRGLIAVDSRGDIVLKLKVWVSNYIGTGYGSGLQDELPCLKGAELLITEKYFNLLKDYFVDKPQYLTLKIVREHE